MKTTMLYSLLFLMMLGVGIGCKKEVEEVKPPVVVTPPVSTTPASPTTAGKIVRIVFKEASKQVFDDVLPEQVTINGKAVIVNKKNETAYFYDSQNRLVLEVLQESPTLIDSTRFYYYPTYVVSAGYGYKNGKLVGQLIDTLSVDENGFMKQFSGGNSLKRNTQGYFADYASTILEIRNGNVTRITSSALEGNGHLILAYDYDSTRFPPPRPRNFWGPESYHLRVKETISEDRGTTTSIWAVYIKTNDYIFDKQGRVIQKIQYATRTNTGFWPYETLSNITEYQYAP